MANSDNLDFLSLHPFVRATVADKVRGTIVGAALGDCIGLYTEFLSKQLSWEAYPSAKFQLMEPATQFKNDGHRNKFTRRSWTDDTDHALLILLSYLHHDGKLLPNDLATRLRTWCEQGLRCLERLPLGLGRTVGRVVLDKTYLTDPTLTAHKYWVAGEYHAAPNGSLMRTHPLGVICVGKTVEETFRIATEFSLVTHADLRCVLACCISTALIRGILRGDVQTQENVDAMINRSFEWVDGWAKRGRKFEDENVMEDGWVDTRVEKDDENEEQKQNNAHLKPEPPLDRNELDRHITVKDFDELELDDSMKMGYVYKSLGVAILALRRAIQASRSKHISSDKVSFSRNIFENITTNIVMEGGDADTNGCIAGAFLGAWLGYTALPPPWSDGIENRDWLLQKCESLSQTVGITNNIPEYKGSEDPDTWEDGGKGLLDKAALERREMAFMEIYLRKGAERNSAEKQKKGWKEKLFSK